MRILVVTSYYDLIIKGIYTDPNKFIDSLEKILPENDTFDITGDLEQYFCETFPREALLQKLTRQNTVEITISSSTITWYSNKTFLCTWMDTDEPLENVDR